MHLPIDELRTERLHARKLELEDAETIYEIFSDDRVTRYWGTPKMTDRSDAETFIKATHEGFESGELLEWGIIETATEQLIGVSAYASWDQKNRRAEIGFALNRKRWGKGLMKEWLAVFIPYGFETLKLHRIEADVDPRNKASIKLLEFFGFKKEGHLRERYHAGGEVQDSLIYGLLQREYPF